MLQFFLCLVQDCLTASAKAKEDADNLRSEVAWLRSRHTRGLAAPLLQEEGQQAVEV